MHNVNVYFMQAGKNPATLHAHLLSLFVGTLLLFKQAPDPNFSVLIANIFFFSSCVLTHNKVYGCH